MKIRAILSMRNIVKSARIFCHMMLVTTTKLQFARLQMKFRLSMSHVQREFNILSVAVLKYGYIYWDIRHFHSSMLRNQRKID